MSVINLFFPGRTLIMDIFSMFFWAAVPIGDKVLWNGEKFHLSVRPSVRPSIHPSVHPSIHPLGIEGLPEGSKGLSEGPDGLPGLQRGLRACQEAQGGTDGWMHGRTDGRTEFLPIPQDFVPCRGRCPKKLSLRYYSVMRQRWNAWTHLRCEDASKKKKSGGKN